MAEPQGDYAGIGAGLQQAHRRRVSDDVGRHRCRCQFRVPLGRGVDRQLQSLRDVRARHRQAVSARQQRGIGQQIGIQLQPIFDGLGRGLPEGQGPLLAALAVQPDARCRPEHHVEDADTDDLRHSSASVKHQRQHQAVALADPGVGRHVDHGQHLFPRDEADHPAVESLHRHRQRLLDDTEMSRIVPGGELQERPHCRQADVTAAHRVLALLFEVIEEAE